MTTAADLARFSYVALPIRTIFGAGRAAELGEELERLGVRRAMICTTPRGPERYRALVAALGPRAAGVFAGAEPHCPEPVVQAAVERFRALDADGAVAIGGGSTIGLGKAIALQTGLPIVAVPTTYAGSEMTPIWGLTEGGVKKTGRDARVLPRSVIYDPELTLSLPPALSATSGMNAIAHCVEALYAQDANPVISLMAEEGIRALAQGLPRLVREPQAIEARGDALYGAWLAGSALGAVGMALHHKLCHTLGGSYNLPHAEVHTVVLPHAVAYNRRAAPQAMARIARALGLQADADPAAGLYDLSVRLGAPRALREIGLRAEDLDQAADLATRNPYYNPRAVTRAGIRDLLQAAFDGARPA
jgi:maleylacetate reductase